MSCQRLGCLLILILLPAAALCQVTSLGSSSAGPSFQGSALEMPVDPQSYVLGPGDSVLISVTGLANYIYPTVVTPEGKLLLLMPAVNMDIGRSAQPEKPLYNPVAQIKVSGMTIAEAQLETNAVGSKYFKNTEILLTLMSFRRLRVSVVGDVLLPGVYTATSISRVSDVLALAQLRGTASRTAIELITRDTLRAKVNLYDFELTGDPGGNPYVRDGDVVRVPSMEKAVTVRGAVYGSGIYTLRVSELTAEQTRVSEGIYELEDGDRISDVIRKAGGILPWADLGASYIERRSIDGKGLEKIVADLEKILVQGDASADPEMLDGDVLNVASIEDVVYVEGAVNTPGAVQFTPGLAALAYIGMAGGPTDRASMKRARVVRPDGKVIAVKDNPEIKRGDTVFVPEVTLKWWQDYVAVTSAATSVLIAWLTLTR